jgi:hypothetical protein
LLLVVASALAACAGSGGSAPADTGPATGGNAACASGQNYESTYDAIQGVIFDGHGCTNDTCHGSAVSGGLDLRAGSSYAHLVGAHSTSSDFLRVEPGESSRSYLFLKLEAATNPGTAHVAGSPMPLGLQPLSADQLEGIRFWIDAGAPKDGSVADAADGSSKHVAELLGACLPPASNIYIDPLTPPPAGEGLQLAMAPYVLPGNMEREICQAQYVDFSDQVPAQYKDPSGNFMFVDGWEMRQDPNSHHLIADHSGLDASSVHDPSFGTWTCSGGPRDGAECEPTDPASCDGGICHSSVRDDVACIGYGPGDSAVNVAAGGFAGAQTAQRYEPPREGVYQKIPIRGIVYFNSHAFNLISTDHLMHSWINLLFAKSLAHEETQLVDTHAIYIQAGQAPFTTKHYCANHTFDQGTALLSLNSHTHKRGRNFSVTAPDGTNIYQSYVYSDPLNQEFDPPLRFDSADPAERTVRYCADYNNGVMDDGSPDVELVTKLSTMPARTTCTPVACTAGRIGAACSGPDDNATCDSSPGAGDGKCDACPITAGVTTENEMFVLGGYYYVGPD